MRLEISEAAMKEPVRMGALYPHSVHLNHEQTSNCNIEFMKISISRNMPKQPDNEELTMRIIEQLEGCILYI